MTGAASGESGPAACPIRIFRVDPMDRSPFDATKPHPIMAAADVTFVDDPGSADVIVARKVGFLEPYRRHDTVFVVWTHEPRWSFSIEPVTRHPWINNPIHVMNAYTGNIYSDYFYNFSSRKLDFDTAMRDFLAVKPVRAVMLASYRSAPTEVMWNGVDCDLLQYRQTLGLHLQARGFCAIFGRQIPPRPKDVNISGNSREGVWQPKKMEILKGYAINVALENTLIPNYVTEKMWDAIVGACLPVYRSGNGIYRLFPKGSFIDTKGKTVEEVADQIMALSRGEMAERYEACLKAYLAIYDEKLRTASRDGVDRRTVEFLRAAVAATARERAARREGISRRLARQVRRFEGEARRAWYYLSSTRERKYARI